VCASGYLLKEESIERIIEALNDVEEGAPMSPKIARKTLKILQGGTARPAEKATVENNVLTTREMEILGHIIDGQNYHQIGALLFISPLTVKKHIRNIYEKLHVNTKLSAVKVAMKKGWFSK
jgi:DNA-binding NarL/FixJ family response regulator